MTQNQINFAKLQEEKRHNVATEGLSQIELQETQRHNVASEGYSLGSLSEAERHNLAQESLNWYSAQNLSSLQYYQGQQAQSQAYFNDVRSMLETAQYELDRWFKHEQISVSNVDAATRERAQKATERQIGAQIDNLMRRLNMDERMFETNKAKIVSEIVKNYISGGQSVGELATIIAGILG